MWVQGVGIEQAGGSCLKCMFENVQVCVLVSFVSAFHGGELTDICLHSINKASPNQTR
jgi:hypothetical protein